MAEDSTAAVEEQHPPPPGAAAADPPPAVPTVVPAAALTTRTLQQLYENDDAVSPNNRHAFILMVAPEAVPGFDVDTTHPYPTIKNLKGYKSLFNPNKKLICLEAKRRSPGIKLNNKNRKNNDMIGDLSGRLGHLLTDEDKQFVIAKEAEMRALLCSKLACMSETTTVRRVLSSANRLQLVACIGLEKNLRLYKKSQDCANREDLDAGTSPKCKLHGALTDTFNDEEYIATIPSMPSLHEDFQEEQSIEKGEYTMTAKKVADLLQSRKLEMKTISEKFDQSGNGENMIGEDDGEVIDGAKRSAFLRGKPSDLLYWWKVFEENDLMTMTFAEFGSNAVDGTTAPAGGSNSEDDSSTASSTPASTPVYKVRRGRLSYSSSTGGSRKKKARTETRPDVSLMGKELSKGLSDANKNTCLNRQSLYDSQRANMEEKEFELIVLMDKYKDAKYLEYEWESLQEWEESDARWKAYKRRMQQIKNSITQFDSRLEAIESRLEEMD